MFQPELAAIFPEKTVVIVVFRKLVFEKLAAVVCPILIVKPFIVCELTEETLNAIDLMKFAAEE